MTAYLGAIDQGTTSTRFIIFDRSGRIVSVAQKEHEQMYPKPGWVEHDPDEIWRLTQEVIQEAMNRHGLRPKDLAAIGITNQRETTLIWNKVSGRPVYNAIVWQDTRVAAIGTKRMQVRNDLLMQFQADILNIHVFRPVIQETTALGAAYAAGLAVGYYQDLEDLKANWAVDYTCWKKAVVRSMDWVD
jgi:glycerol kinase